MFLVDNTKPCPALCEICKVPVFEFNETRWTSDLASARPMWTQCAQRAVSHSQLSFSTHADVLS